MTSWYPRIFASLFKKAPTVDHYFFKNTEITDKYSLNLIIIR